MIRSALDLIWWVGVGLVIVCTFGFMRSCYIAPEQKSDLIEACRRSCNDRPQQIEIVDGRTICTCFPAQCGARP